MWIQESLGLCEECLDIPESQLKCQCARLMKVCDVCGGGPLDGGDFETDRGPDFCDECTA